MKNIDMAKFQKWALIGIVLLAAFLVNIFLAIKPQAKDLSDLRNQYNNNVNMIKKLKDKQSSQEQLQREKKFFKYRLSELNDTLPNYVVPEKFVKSLKTVIMENGLKVSDLNFKKPQEYALTDNKTKPAASEFDAKANKLIDSIFNENGLTTKELEDFKIQNAKELQLSSISDESAFKVDVTFGFIGEYEQIKSFINKLESSSNKTTINSINIETSKDGTKQGTMAVTLYGFKDSKLPVYNLWNPEQQAQGKDDLFSSVGSVTYNVNDTTMSDFDIKLSPITSDIPSVVMSKHGAYGTEIYGDNKGIEKVDLYISQQGDKFYYKYNTQSSTYPTSGNAEFKPVTLGDIVIKVFSESRVSDVDNSGMQLIVHNSTNRNINVVRYGDDTENPRLKY